MVCKKKNSEEKSAELNKPNSKIKSIMGIKSKRSKSDDSSDSNAHSDSNSTDSIDREAMKELSLEQKNNKETKGKMLKSKNVKDKEDKEMNDQKRKRDKAETIDQSDFDNQHIGNLDFQINSFLLINWLKQNNIKHAEIDIKKGYAFTFAAEGIMQLHGTQFRERNISISKAGQYNSIWIKLQKEIDVGQLSEYMLGLKKYKSNNCNENYCIYV